MTAPTHPLPAAPGEAGPASLAAEPPAWPATRSSRSTFLVALALAALAQLSLAYALRQYLFFNDDQESLAYGRFFSSLYVRQFDVHMPLVGLISYLWGHLAGFTPTANRMLAGLFNVGILSCMLALARRYWQSLLVGIAACLVYLVFQVQLWSFCHVSELPSTLFALLGTMALLRLEETRNARGSPLATALVAGLCFGLSAMARIMIVEFVALAALWVLARRWRVSRATKEPFLSRTVREGLVLVGGMLLPWLGFLALFAAIGSARPFLYWSLGHNFQAKGKLNPALWVGDLSLPVIRGMWEFILCALAIAALGYWVHGRRQAQPARSLWTLAALGALGGWLGSNPSGVWGQAMHTIPAFPFLGLLFGAGAVGVWKWALRRARAFAPVLLAPLGLTLWTGWALRQPAGASWEILTTQRINPRFARIASVGAHIRQHSGPEDTLFIFGATPLLYVEADRDSATTFSILYEDVARYEARIIEELSVAPPRFVQMDRHDPWYAQNLQLFPRLAAFLLKNYRVTAEFPELLEPRHADNARRLFSDPAHADTFAQALREEGLKVSAVHEPRCLADACVLTANLPMRFEQDQEWREVSLPLRLHWEPGLEPSQLSVRVELELDPPERFRSTTLRFLFDGPGGLSHANYWLTWVPLSREQAGRLLTITLPLDGFQPGAGTLDWREVTQFQVGAWGPEGGTVVVRRVSFEEVALRLAD